MLPDVVVGSKNSLNVGRQRHADCPKKGKQFMSNRPVAVLQPDEQLEEHRLDCRESCFDRASGRLDVTLVLWNQRVR